MNCYIDTEGNVLENTGVSKYINGPSEFLLYIGEKVEIINSSMENEKIYYYIKIDKDYFWVLSEGKAVIEYNKELLYNNIEILSAYNPDTKLLSRFMICPFDIENLEDIINYTEKQISKGKVIDYYIEYL